MGFTRKELAVLLFLAVAFLSGLGVWLVRSRFAPLPEPGPLLDIEGNHSTEGEDRHPQENRSKDDQTHHVESRIGTEETQSVRILVHLNQSSQDQIETLPGVGPVIASRIVAYRKNHGDFQNIDELLNVKGIGVKTLDRIRPYLKQIQKP